VKAILKYFLRAAAFAYAGAAPAQEQIVVGLVRPFNGRSAPPGISIRDAHLSSPAQY
jgi:hypothetical protein